MSTVNATSSTTSTSATAASATAKAATVDYNMFLKLMVEQLKHQDPTQPTDPTQYLSQLASFSNVEQAIQTNTKLDTLLTTNALTQAENLIGGTLTSADGGTSGRVVSVALGSDGTSTATLSDGSTLKLGSGVTISAAGDTATGA